MTPKPAFRHSKAQMIKKALAVILAGVFLLTDQCRPELCHPDPEPKAKGKDLIESGSSSLLAPPLGSKSDTLKVRFLAGKILLSHKRYNEYIAKKIEETGYDKLDKKLVKINGVDTEAELISIPGLLKFTGLPAHVGLGRYYGRPVIYIDSGLYHNEDIRQHEFDEVSWWEALRRLLGLMPAEMRRWIMQNIDTPVNDKRLEGTEYYNKTTREIAEIIHKNSNRIPKRLYEQYAHVVDYEYLAMLLTIYDDEEAEYKKDVTVAAHISDRENALINQFSFEVEKKRLFSFPKAKDVVHKELDFLAREAVASNEVAKRLSIESGSPVFVVAVAETGTPYGWAMEDPIPKKLKEVFEKEVKGLIAAGAWEAEEARLIVAKKWMGEGKLKWYTQCIDYKISSINPIGLRNIGQFYKDYQDIMNKLRIPLLFVDSSCFHTFPESFAFISKGLADSNSGYETIFIGHPEIFSRAQTSINIPVHNMTDQTGRERYPYIMSTTYMEELGNKVKHGTMLCMCLNPARLVWNGIERPFGSRAWHDTDNEYGRDLLGAIIHIENVYIPSDSIIFKKTVQSRIAALRAQKRDPRVFKPNIASNSLKPNGSSAECLETIKTSDALMRRSLNKDEGIRVRDVAKLRPYHPRTVYKEFKLLKDLGMLVPVESLDKSSGFDPEQSRGVEGKRGYYAFSDMMIGPDKNYTKTIINAINDMRYQLGKRGEGRPLHRGSIPDEKIGLVKELVKMTILHQINLIQRPAIPEGKVLWHILEEGVVSVSQQSSFAQVVNNAADKSKAPERIYIMKRGESIDEAIAGISENCPNAVFDIALSEKSHIENVPGGIKRLVFEGGAGDVAQIEGIIAALRALHGPKEDIIPTLKRIYAALNGSACRYEIPPDAIDDPVRFARSFIFNLPPATPIPIEEISRMNERLLKLLMAA